MRISNDFLGLLAAVAFIVANAYYPAKVLTKKLVGQSPEITRFFRTYLDLHITLNLVGLLLTFIHGHNADERNFLLQTSMLVTVWLCVVGGIMHWGKPSQMYNKMKLLHTQQFMFIVWVLLIIIGHTTL
ncbi:MAG: hypothetical protein HQK88_02375 [Nitrospirae bacterium]|nr:hypothetical protein [Nitrospirota bacterium]MBF0534374.1 hypothetical protein [Nitrospirota bacterium]MBF0615645.1 hypothetical protein [Nitrospirota bacterium]